MKEEESSYAVDRHLQRGTLRFVDLTDFDVHVSTTTTTTGVGDGDFDILVLSTVVTDWLNALLEECLVEASYTVPTYALFSSVELLERAPTAASRQRVPPLSSTAEEQAATGTTTRTTEFTGTARFVFPTAEQRMIPADVVTTCQSTSFTANAPDLAQTLAASNATGWSTATAVMVRDASSTITTTQSPATTTAPSSPTMTSSPTLPPVSAARDYNAGTWLVVLVWWLMVVVRWMR